MVSRANKSLKRGTSAWLQQFIDAIHFEEGNLANYKNCVRNLINQHAPSIENEDVNSDETGGSQEKIVIRNWKDYASHGFTVFWRLVFAIIPPECKFDLLQLRNFIGSSLCDRRKPGVNSWL